MKWFAVFVLIVLRFNIHSQNDSIIRTPYLQQTGSTSTYISWITKNLCHSKIVYGTVKTNLDLISINSTQDTIHSGFLDNLTPNTRYYYTVSLNNTDQHTDTSFFYSAPTVGSSQKMRFLALGDCGSGYTTQYNVKSAINYYRQNNYINGILLLGDNAYEGGMQNEYQLGFFNPYRSDFILDQTCIYPAPGNHDYANDVNYATNHNIPHYTVFDKVPKNGELGGVPSNHKEFYSFNYGNA